MKIKVHIQDSSVDPLMARYIKHTVVKGLRRHKEDVISVEIYLRDLSAARGDMDSECKVLIRSSLSKEIVIKECMRDAGVAFRHAFRRAIFNFRQRLDRERSRFSGPAFSGNRELRWT